MTPDLKMRHIAVPERYAMKWQGVANTLAGVMGVTSAMILRLDAPNFEVISSSENKENPFRAGFIRPSLRSFDDMTIQSGKKFVVHNALHNRDLAINSDVRLGLVSYLGAPLRWQNREIFGVICVLDRRERRFSPILEEMFLNMRELIESHLAFIFEDFRLDTLSREFADDIEKDTQAQGLLPVCVHCSKIKTESHRWQRFDDFIRVRTKTRVTHAICPDCMSKIYSEYDNAMDEKNGETKIIKTSSI
jgi:hypothetical protein